MAASTVIDCSARELWPWLDDLEHRKQWMKGLCEVRSTSRGPRRKGSTSVCVIEEGRTKVELNETALEYEPERRVKLRMEGASPQSRRMAIEVEFELTERGRRTQLDLEIAYGESGWIAGWLGPLIRFLARIQMRVFLKKLKDLAEGKGGVTAST